MPQQFLGLRPAVVTVAMVIALVGALLAVTVADARPTRLCRSADLRYPFTPGGPKTFGVFKLQITGGSCATARRVAKRWMERFEADLRAGRVRLPTSVSGFVFQELPPNAAQTYRLRGRREQTSIRFDYVVPNG
jgi:hypothetical protein